MSKIQVDSIVNKDDTGGVDFPKGVTVTGVVTATSFAGNATGLTGTPNITVGTVTATEGLTLDGQNGSGKGLKLDLAGSGDYTIQETTANDVVQFGGTGTANFFRHNVSSGNIGIATTGDAPLHVFKAGDGQTPVHFQTGNANGHLYFYNDSDGYSLDSGGNLRFVTNRSSSGTPTRMTIESDGDMRFNGGNTSTSNGNVGHIYKFFGSADNIIFPLESSGANRFAVFEYRRTGRVNERTSQISIGENSNSQGRVEVLSSGTNGALSGGVRLENAATSWSSISDIRLKNVVSHFDNALQDVSTLDAFRFTWKNDASETLQVGLSAQSVQAVLPEATIVSGKPIDAAEDDDTEYLSVRYTEVIPLLVAALQESKERIETLEEQNAAILARLDALEAG